MSLPALVSSWCPLFERGPALRRLALMFGDERYLVAVGRYFFFSSNGHNPGLGCLRHDPACFCASGVIHSHLWQAIDDFADRLLGTLVGNVAVDLRVRFALRLIVTPVNFSVARHRPRYRAGWSDRPGCL